MWQRENSGGFPVPGGKKAVRRKGGGFGRPDGDIDRRPDEGGCDSFAYRDDSSGCAGSECVDSVGAYIGRLEELGADRD